MRRHQDAVEEHAWENHHLIPWEETTVLDHSRGQELLVKELTKLEHTTDMGIIEIVIFMLSSNKSVVLIIIFNLTLLLY